MAGHTFTPGPWHVDDGGDGEIMIWDGTGGPYLAEVYEGPNDLANARLIAAAPELLEACELFVQEYGLRKGPNDELDPADEQSAPVASAMRAIAKATESQA